MDLAASNLLRQLCVTRLRKKKALEILDGNDEYLWWANDADLIKIGKQKTSSGKFRTWVELGEKGREVINEPSTASLIAKENLNNTYKLVTTRILRDYNIQPYDLDVVRLMSRDFDERYDDYDCLYNRHGVIEFIIGPIMRYHAVIVAGFCPGNLYRHLLNVRVSSKDLFVRNWPGSAITEGEWMAMDPFFAMKGDEIIIEVFPRTKPVYDPATPRPGKMPIVDDPLCFPVVFGFRRRMFGE